MHMAANIFGAQFGAYSFKNYVPIIAAVVVAAVVGEISYNAKMKRQRREQAQRISRLRQLVRKQRMRRDLALLEAEKQERRALERRGAARRHLYRSEVSEHLSWHIPSRNRAPHDVVEGTPLDNFHAVDYLQVGAKQQVKSSRGKSSTSLPEPAVSMGRRPRPFIKLIPAQIPDEHEEDRHDIETPPTNESDLRSVLRGQGRDDAATSEDTRK